MLPENSVLEALTSMRGEEHLPASASCCRVPNDLGMTLNVGTGARQPWLFSLHLSS